MQNILSKSLKDIFSKDVLFFVFKIGSISFIVAITLVWYFWDTLSSFIASYLLWLPWEWLQTSGAKAISLASAYMLFIIIISLLTSLYSEKLLIKLAKKHYPNIPVVGSVDIQTSIFSTIKASTIFLLLFILTLPFLFIPFLGQALMLYLWSILIKEPTTYDVGSLFIGNKKIINEKMKKTRILAMIASLFNYLPLINIFAPVFAQILFLHHIVGSIQLTDIT